MAQINISIPQAVLDNLQSLRVLDLSPDIGTLRNLPRLPIFKVTSEETNSTIQLGQLQELQGSLHDRKLENIDNPDEAKEAMQYKEDKLSMLQLMWASARDEVDANKESEMLENLQPHPNLKRLDIMGWDGSQSPQLA
ncbi:hypothetical protein ABZP36_005198 [Zizania latifolia]